MAPFVALIVKALIPHVVGKVASVITTPKKETRMDVVMGLIRHLMTAGGGILAAKGYVDSGTVETVVGAVITLLGALWSVYDKKKEPAEG